MPVRSVVFDFGNVIAFFDHGKACRQLARLCRPAVDPGAIYDAVFKGGLEHDYDSGRVTTPQFLERLRTTLPLDATDADIGTAWSDIFRPNEPVARLLPQLHSLGLRLVLGSNTNALHHAWFSHEFAEPLSYFDAQVLSYRIGCRKPDRRFYEACIDASQCPVSACLYVDDRADLIEAAGLVGLRGVVYAPALDLNALIEEERRAASA